MTNNAPILEKSPTANGFQIRAYEPQTRKQVGVVRVVQSTTAGEFELEHLETQRDAQGKQLAKQLYRTALQHVIDADGKLFSGVRRSPLGESICRMLAAKGRAFEVESDEYGGYLQAPNGLSTEQTAGLPQPENDSQGKPGWPVWRWRLDPQATDSKSTGNLDSPTQAPWQA